MSENRTASSNTGRTVHSCKEERNVSKDVTASTRVPRSEGGLRRYQTKPAFRKRIKLSNSDAFCLKTDSNAMVCSDASFINSFWQNTVESDIQIRIMEFAAATMGKVYLLSQTCKQWDEILNHDPDTADPIWHRIAKKYYGVEEGDRRHLRRLEIMDSACRHEDNTEWRRLLFIDWTPMLFSGDVWPYLKLLTCFFCDEPVDPYTSMSWREGIIQKEVSAAEYWCSLGVDCRRRRSSGLDCFEIAFTDGSMEENFQDMTFKVHYFDHDYTVANFESECRLIHRWLHVFGFHHHDFSIDPPEPYSPNVIQHGYIVVRLADRYRVGGRRVLCLGSMTIKEDTSPCDIDNIRYQDYWLCDLSAEEGEPVIRREGHCCCGPFPWRERRTYIPNIGNIRQGGKSDEWWDAQNAILLRNSNLLCLTSDSNAMSCSCASFMHSFWQNTVESEIQIRIMEFAATTMGDVYLLSRTCKPWDDIINQNPDTADPIWHRFAKIHYGGDRRHLWRLEIMDSACRHEDNTEWRLLLFIERSLTLKIFSGEMGPYLKLLAWVFRSDRVVPYNAMRWKEGNIWCKVSAEEYWFDLEVSHYHSRERGIDRFDIDFYDTNIEENFAGIAGMDFRVHYMDHDYTVPNFETECRIIHRWLHVFGFHHYDFVIDSPEAEDEGRTHGFITVKLIDHYRHRRFQNSVLCLGSMTIKENTSRHEHEIIRYQDSGWWDYCAEEGEPVRSKLIHFVN